MAVTIAPFGRTAAGEEVLAGRIENAAGMAVTVLSYGATVQSIQVPDRAGGLRDVALGYDTLAEYEANDGYLGATVGRVGNRIGGARFWLNGQEYPLAKNDGENHLHGGARGFDKYVWDMAAGADSLICSRVSPDGEEGYPGALTVTVTFTVTADSALVIDYAARSDRDTVVNLTNHTYFNLSGGGSALDHELRLSAGRFCENDGGCLPTGMLLDVAGTAFDFRESKPLGRDIGAAEEQLRLAGGYDHCFAREGGPAAVLYSPASGIEMTVETDMPGVQVYTANFLTARPGKGGAVMGPRDAVCLETQLFPNAMNCWGFPSPVLRAGRPLSSRTAYRFAVR